MDKNNIRLRALEPEDADFLYEVESDPDAWKYSDYVAPLSKELLRQYAYTYDANPYQSGQLRLIIENDGEPIGIVDLFDISARHLRADTGIYVLPKYRGYGFATQALKELAAYGRERLGLHQMSASISKLNQSAMRCYCKAGFIATGVRPDWIRTADGFEDICLLSLLLPIRQPSIP